MGLDRRIYRVFFRRERVFRDEIIIRGICVWYNLFVFGVFFVCSNFFLYGWVVSGVFFGEEF